MPILFFVLWIIFNGRLTLEIVIFGAVISAFIYAFAVKVMDYSPASDLRVFRNLPVFLHYCINLIVEIVKASFSVMKVALDPHARPEPVVVEFRSGLEEDFMNVILANSITLTPGTITIFQEKDHFVVHALKEEYAEGIESSSFVTLLRRFK
jgi:multicomponent Na+:H+ antiporter subunit E